LENELHFVKIRKESMMERIKLFFRAFFAHAHELGAIYYSYAILTGIGGAAYSIYKQLSVPEIHGESELFFWVFVVAIVIVMLILPMLVMALLARENSKNDQVANPNLIIKKRRVDYEIQRESLLKKQTVSLEALGRVASFRFQVSVTGVGTTKARLTMGGTLRGPISRGSYDSYEIDFSNPLEKGQLTSISFEISVTDPGRTMRPFLSDRFHSAAKYGAFEASYLFDVQPKKVTRERSTVAGETLESTDLLHTEATGNKFRYDFSVAKVDSHCVYTVSWIW
jgi:hypothetical protein